MMPFLTICSLFCPSVTLHSSDRSFEMGTKNQFFGAGDINFCYIFIAAKKSASEIMILFSDRNTAELRIRGFLDKEVKANPKKLCKKIFSVTSFRGVGANF